MNFTPGLLEEGSRAKKRRKLSRKQLIVIASVVAVLLLAISSAVFFFAKYNNLKQQASSSSSHDLQERISKKVAMHYDAPNETPTIAQVNNKAQLQKQQGEFFNNAQDGDYLVIYPKKQIAVIYRESTDKIVNTGPIDLKSQNNNPGGNGTQDISSPAGQ